MDNNFIFWDEMWNKPKAEDKESTTICCGKGCNPCRVVEPVLNKFQNGHINRDNTYKN